MQLRTIALAAVLLAGPAAAQETKSQSQQKSETKQQEQPGEEKAKGAKDADTQKAEPGSMKGYGYGTPSGVETESTGQASAQKRKTPKTPQQEEGASVTQPHARAEQPILSGEIVSTGKNRLTIQAPDGMRDIQVTGKTEVRGAGRKSVAQLKRGDQVRVSFDPKAGVSVAKRIEVREDGAARSGKGAELTPPPGSSTPPGSTTTPSGTPAGPAPGTSTQGGTTAPGGEGRK
ncbi:hypothetical protein [Anaeromyxobacter terrae]|uniref:hypothetical protein n=1 Tax=Anaeromyxobacter terrae TaxID=2925406 RepID=UPI001F56C6DE|nr:hypothetical protein [Anaeromyxobacter sp. SG22]